jgi:hypothetical protein
MPTMGTAWPTRGRIIFGSECAVCKPTPESISTLMHQVTVRVHHWAGGAQAMLDRKHLADPAVRDGVLSVTLDDPTGKSRLSLKTKPN